MAASKGRVFVRLVGCSLFVLPDYLRFAITVSGIQYMGIHTSDYLLGSSISFCAHFSPSSSESN